MKTCIENLFLLPALIVGLGMMLDGRATAQTFTTLHSFTATTGGFNVNSDGASPYGGLVLLGNTLFGTALLGGSSGGGAVFKVNTDGTGFTNFYSFTLTAGAFPYGNADGAEPQAGLILSGSTLYGTARNGGTVGDGTVFKVNTDGTGFTNLHSFPAIAPTFPNGNSDGDYPIGSLILSGNTLFGTAQNGGGAGKGTVFRVNTDGTGFTNLHSFLGYPNDGGQPRSGFILSGNLLFGTAYGGGSGDNGTVFRLNTDGTGFTNLYSFTTRLPPTYTSNSDGALPAAGLILSGNTLYGVVVRGGNFGNGTVFKINTDGTGFTTLHIFTATPPVPGPYTNSDGSHPSGELVLSGNTLYGTAQQGGSSGYGTVFAINTDGSGFKNLYSFTATTVASPYSNSDGANPAARLILSGNSLYGTAVGGGSFGKGTVFSISLPAGAPQLSIIRSAASVVLTWPTNFLGFTLQSATNLAAPTIWVTNTPAPVIVNGQNTVTNPAAGTQKFYRLSQ